MASDQELKYAAQIFIRGALPLIPVIAQHSKYGAKLAGKNGIIQFRVRYPEGDMEGMHIVIEDGELTNQLGLVDQPDVELYFADLEHFVNFFRGTSKKLPKIKGFTKLGLLIPTFQILLTMAKVLGADYRPQSLEDKLLTIRLYFYLLPAGISALNRMGHPEVKNWSKLSPDRVYAYSLDGQPDIGSYLRVKAGKTKAARSPYTRSQPFFTMRFADPDSALAVLQQTGDMLELTMQQKLIMEGAPEFGGQIGDLMMLVGKYAQA